MLKVFSIFGTRPEAIKMAPIIKGLKKQSEKFLSRVCVTDQHREMLDQVLSLFEIRSDYNLNIMLSEQNIPGNLLKVWCWKYEQAFKCSFRNRPNL